MLKRSHFLIGASAGAAVAHTLGEPLLAGVVVSGLAGVVSDADHPSSAVGRLLPRWFHRLTPGHRGISHSLAFCAALVALVALWSPPLALLAGAGLLSHLAADGVTEAGIPWAYPFSRRRVALPRLLAIKTGGIAEALVVVAVVAATGRWLLG